MKLTPLLMALFAGTLLLTSACKREAATSTTSPTPIPSISEAKAIAIAATQLPLAVVERASVNADRMAGWRVFFEGVYTTEEELGWEKNSITVFDPFETPAAPRPRPVIYRAAVILVNPTTGEIGQRIATNGVFSAPAPALEETAKPGWGCTK